MPPIKTDGTGHLSSHCQVSAHLEWRVQHVGRAALGQHKTPDVWLVGEDVLQMADAAHEQCAPRWGRGDDDDDARRQHERGA